jgi:hypothetical protein
MERKPAVAVVFHHIGPYHHARFNAAARSVTDSDCAYRRLIDQSARRRLPPSPVDFMVVNDSTNPDRLPARIRG